MEILFKISLYLYLFPPHHLVDDADVALDDLDDFGEGVVIYNLKLKRLYLHESFLTEKIPEIVASSLVRDGKPVSPQSRGVLTNILSLFIKSN